MRKFKRKIGESYRPKFTKICYTGKGIQLEDGEGRVLRGKVFASEEEARAYATRMYGFCRNESTMKKRGKTMWKRINESRNLGRKNELDMYDESWIGDKMKAGWDAVKSGAKKVGKAIGDAFKGPFRKGDHIVMKGENGEEFKGTIKDFDLGEKTYEVMLGNAVNEDWEGRGLEEQVLDMPDRVEELENEIEKLWVRLGDVDDGTVMKLIAAYVELEQIEPGRVDF